MQLPDMPPTPPASPAMLTCAQARGMFGVSRNSWDIWEKKGRIKSTWGPRSTGSGRQRWYHIDDINRLKEEIRRLEEEPPSFPPGLLPRTEAARMFGVALRTWSEWETAGRITIPRHSRKNRHGPPNVLYAVADLERLREEFRNQPKCVIPPGLVDRHEAARLFDISSDWWGDWENLGRMPVRCVWVPSGNGPPYKMYPLDELLAFREQWRNRFQPRPDPERPGCYRVPLVHRTYDPREAIIDAESLPLVQGRNWHWEFKIDGHLGCVALASTLGSNTPLKRIIMGLEHAGREMRVSHANENPLDCRRENLVVRTIAEQHYATRKMGSVIGREYTSKYKGVSWHEPTGKWKAQIQHEGRNRCIGLFDEEEDAALAYDNAARELFGEHARVNFPEPHELPSALIAPIRAAA